MKAQHLLVAGLAFAFAAPQPALAQADLLTAKKFSCIPDRLTRCSADNKCESKDATPRDKGQPLIIDTEKKVAVLRRDNQERQFGTIVEDKVEGDMRKMTLREASGDPAKASSLALTLTRAGKLTMASSDGRMRAEASCSPET